MSSSSPLLRDGFDLRRGAARCFYLRAGSHVIAQRGVLQLTEPPQWIGEQIRQPVLRLCANTAHEICEGGWVRLDAAEDCRVQVLVPSPAPSLLARLRATLGASARAWQRSGQLPGVVDQA